MRDIRHVFFFKPARYMECIRTSAAEQLHRTQRCSLHLREVIDQRGRPVGRHVLPFQDVFLPRQLADLPFQRVDVLAPRLRVRVGR